MAGKPKKRQRMREQIADKVVKGELLSPEEGEWLHKEGMAIATLNPSVPFTTETAKAALAKKKEMKLRKEQAADEAYKKFAEDALGPSAEIQMLALRKVLDQARVLDPNTGEFVLDPAAVDGKDLNRALGVAEKIADRVLGKSTTKIQGDMNLNFIQQLRQSGEL